MKLKTLAKKASRLPEIDFDWAGIEQVHEEVFEKDMEKGELEEYVREMKVRLSQATKAIYELKKAYEALKDLILEAEIDDLTDVNVKVKENTL